MNDKWLHKFINVDYFPQKNKFLKGDFHINSFVWCYASIGAPRESNGATNKQSLQLK